MNIEGLSDDYQRIITLHETPKPDFTFLASNERDPEIICQWLAKMDYLEQLSSEYSLPNLDRGRFVGLTKTGELRIPHRDGICVTLILARVQSEETKLVQENMMFREFKKRRLPGFAVAGRLVLITSSAWKESEDGKHIWLGADRAGKIGSNFVTWNMIRFTQCLIDRIEENGNFESTP